MQFSHFPVTEGPPWLQIRIRAQYYLYLPQISSVPLTSYIRMGGFQRKDITGGKMFHACCLLLSCLELGNSIILRLQQIVFSSIFFMFCILQPSWGKGGRDLCPAKERKIWPFPYWLWEMKDPLQNEVYEKLTNSWKMPYFTLS